MNFRTSVWAILAALAIIGATVGVLSTRRDRTVAPQPVADSLPPAITPRATAKPKPTAIPAATTPEKTMLARILELLDRIQRGLAQPGEIAALRRELLDSPDGAATIAAILDFLRTGTDAKAGRALIPGEGGTLADAPTMRVLMMDLLGQLSKKTRSNAAALFAREVLASPTSADEWAISMRNVAWQDPSSAAFLAAKMREMLANPAWRADPSAGMLEAFDVIVHTRDVSFVDDLAPMLADPQTDLQRAAAVALDRLADTSTLAVMQKLNNEPQLMAERPFMRADYFAKADLAQQTERTAVEIYLARPDVKPAEKEKFLKAIVMPGEFISENLITDTPAPVDNDAARLGTIGKVTGEWLAKDRFPELRAPLLGLQERLPR